jgi:hypothetical protein
LVVAGSGVSVISLTQPDRPAPEPQAEAVEVPAGSDFETAREDTAPTLPDAADGAPQPGDAPQIEAADGSETPVDEAATQPAARPETGTPQGSLTAPDAEGDAAQSTAPTQTPEVSEEVAQPAMPATEDEGKISTDPAQPAPPAAEQTAFPEDETVDATPKAEADAPPAPTQRAKPLPSVTDPVADPVEDTAEQSRPSIGTPVGTFTDRDEPVAAPEPAAEPALLRPIEANAMPFDNPEA